MGNQSKAAGERDGSPQGGANKKNDKQRPVEFRIDGAGRLRPQPTEAEIDEIIKLADSGRFASGIYNWCDRWCERCGDKEKCFLYAQQELVNNHGQKAGEQDFVSEMEYNFAVAGKLIERTIKEQEIEVNKDEADRALKEEEREERRFEQAACLKLARKYMKAAHEFFDEYEQARQNYKSELNLSFPDNDIRDDLEVLNWYHTFLPVKVWRALSDRTGIEKEEMADVKELMMADFPKLIALVEKCFDQSYRAISALALRREVWTGQALERLLCPLKLAEISFREEFGLPERESGQKRMPESEFQKIMETYDRDPGAGLTVALRYLAGVIHCRVIYGVIGEMLLQAGEFKPALGYLEIGARLNPRDPVAQLVFGVALTKTGRFNRGRAVLERAYGLSNDDQEAKRQLAIATAMLGRFKEDATMTGRGREMLKEIVVRDKGNAEAMVDLAQSYLMAHDFFEAFEWIARAKQADPQSEFVNMIYADIENAKRKLESDRGFRDNIEKRKVIKAYSGPKPADDEDMDEHLAKQFEIEELINRLNQGGQTPEEIAKVMKQLEKIGLAGQVTAISDENSPEAKVASEYIGAHQRFEDVEKKLAPEEIAALGRELLEEKIGRKRRQNLILRLAHQGRPDALAILEKFKTGAQGEWAVWAKMAADECRAFMDSDGEKPGMFFSSL